MRKALCLVLGLAACGLGGPDSSGSAVAAQYEFRGAYSSSNLFYDRESRGYCACIFVSGDSAYHCIAYQNGSFTVPMSDWTKEPACRLIPGR